MAAHTTAHTDEITEPVAPGECPIRPVRHRFGITSFGSTHGRRGRRATAS